MSTFTRCSSTPSAETLVNAPGSTLRTRPCSTPGPPQRSMRTGAPGRACRASVVSSGATTSRRVVSPSSSSGAPSATRPSLACATRSTRPEMGARTSKAPGAVALALAALAERAVLAVRGAPEALALALAAPERVAEGAGATALAGRRTSSSAARAWAASKRAACWSCCAAAASAWATRTARRCSSSRVGATKPCCAKGSLRRRSLCAWASAAWLRSRRAPAACTRAWAASTRACCSRRLRSSKSAGSAGVSRASTSPACTASPSRNAMRSSRPASGAETL